MTDTRAGWKLVIFFFGRDPGFQQRRLESNFAWDFSGVGNNILCAVRETPFGSLARRSRIKNPGA